MNMETGSRLGPYEITGPIGAGGMGEVYRARDTRLGREVAIKVLPHEVSRDSDRVARFEREARSASALNHRNIVTVHDFNTTDGQAWLVMELVRGDSLRELVERGALPLKKVLSLGAGIADGLAAAHASGLVHRDLKPENVMIASDGTPKILDFGLVKQTSIGDTNSPTAMQVSRSGVVMGTAAYMSPEQARGQSVDFRTDQFSLGMMLQEMATGRHPFRRATGADTVAAILSDEPEPLDQSFPGSFVTIVERCLAKSAADRYGSTSDLAHDLHNVLDRGGSRPAITRSHHGQWLLPVASAIAAAAIVTLITFFAWHRPAETTPDVVQSSIATPEMSQLLLGESPAISTPLALSPDGRYLVVNGTTPEAKRQLSLHDLRAGTVRMIADNAFAPAWSSDGKAVVFFADGKLNTIPVDGGPARAICDARPEGTPSWSGDTILYVQYSRNPGIYRVNAAAGATPSLLIPLHARGDAITFPWWPQFLADGRRFLYVNLVFRASGQGIVAHELMVGSLDGAVAKKLPGQFDSRVVIANGHLLFVRDGTLMAQPFDGVGARFTGEARPVVDGVFFFRNTANAAFTASQNGHLAWSSPLPPSRLVWLDRTGFEIKSIGDGTFNADGRLSPDGNRYAVGLIDPKSGAGDVWLYDLVRESAQRLTFEPVDEKAPVWGPDGRTIYYRTDAYGPPDIARWRLGDDHPTLLFRGPEVEEPQDVSSDGKWLLFVVYTSVGSDIDLLPLSPPGNARPFVATPFNEFAPRFSPDSRFVAYASDLSGRPEVYVRSFEGSVGSNRVSKDGGTRPRWSYDGKELFFLAPEGRLMAVPMNGDVPGVPRMLFQASTLSDFEPSRDGTRFIAQFAEHLEPPVHLLINWTGRIAP